MCQQCWMRQICNQCRCQCGGSPYFWGGIGVVRCCGNNGCGNNSCGGNNCGCNSCS